jgi:hypothetical protein
MMEASMTTLTDHRRSTDKARAELVLTQRQLRGCAVMFVCGEWLAVTGDLDTALETVSDRAGASI